MKLRILLSMLLLSSTVYLTGCSSSEDETAASDEVAAEETAGEETADLDPTSSEEATGEEVAAEDAEATEGEEVTADLNDEELNATEGEETTETVAATETKEETDDLDDLENADFGDGTEEAAAPEVAAAEPPAPEEPAAEETAATEEEPATDEAATTEDTSSTETFASEDTGAASEKTWIPVKKVKEVPFEKGGVWANAVYIARPGEDMAAISQKIYNEDKSGDLLTVNPHLSAGVKVGDKVYYNSPLRPTDHERMLTYYEDKGVTPQTYVTKAGDNIRNLSKEWLGDEGSWKEVWATNAGVESKDIIPEGTELKYWTSDEGGTPVAANEPPPAPAAPEMPAVDLPPPPTQQVNNLPPPTAPEAIPPMPGTDQMAAGGAMPGTVGGDVPPPPGMGKKKPGKEIASAGADKNMKFMMLAGAVIAIGMVVLLAARKKNAARKMSINAHTQV